MSQIAEWLRVGIRVNDTGPNKVKQPDTGHNASFNQTYPLLLQPLQHIF